MSTVLIHADASTFDPSHEPTTRSSMLPLSATSRLMRKSSVHDVHESTRDEFNEVIIARRQQICFLSCLDVRRDRPASLSFEVSAGNDELVAGDSRRVPSIETRPAGEDQRFDGSLEE